MKKFSKKKLATMLGTLVVALATAYFEKSSHSSKSNPAQTSTTADGWIYTKHAKCRMDCRFLNSAEVEDVILNGTINSRKSNSGAKPCPVIAKEKRTVDKQNARVVYAHCPDKVKIITVIDLGKKHNCNCK